MRRPLLHTAALTTLLIAGCGSNATPQADSTPTTTSKTTTATKTRTPSPATSTTTTPPAPPPPYRVFCQNGIGSSQQFTTIDEVWAYPGDFTTCKVNVQPAYQPTETEQQAIASYLTFVPTEKPLSALGIMLEICADKSATADDLGGWNRSVLQGLMLLCPGAPHAGTVGVLAAGESFRDGNHTIGEGVVPGTYRSEPGVRDCYWERLSGSGQTLANDFVTFAPDGVTVTIRPSDGGFSSDGCGRWSKVG